MAHRETSGAAERGTGAAGTLRGLTARRRMTLGASAVLTAAGAAALAMGAGPFGWLMPPASSAGDAVMLAMSGGLAVATGVAGVVCALDESKADSFVMLSFAQLFLSVSIQAQPHLFRIGLVPDTVPCAPMVAWSAACAAFAALGCIARNGR